MSIFLKNLSWLPTLNPLHALSTTAKLILIWLVVISVFGFGYFYALRQSATLEEFAELEERIEQFKIAALKTKINIILSEKMLNKFLLNHKFSASKDFISAINDANNDTAVMEKLAFADEQQKLIYQLRDVISSYQRTASNLVTNFINIGLTENDGQRKELSKNTLQLDLKQQSYTKESSNKNTQINIEFFNLFQQLHILKLDLLEHPDEKHVDKFNNVLSELKQNFNKTNFSTKEKSRLDQLFKTHEQSFNKLSISIKKSPLLHKEIEKHWLEVENLIDSVIKVTVRNEEASKEEVDEGAEELNEIFINLIFIFGIIITVSLGMISYGIINALKKLKNTMGIMGGSDPRIHNALRTGIEFVALEKGLNMLLTQREERAVAIAKENDDLNESVMRLTDAAEQLSKGDLTIKLPVSYDITGNISDALNVMTRETARVIFAINKVAAQLEQAAKTVNQHGDTVFLLAKTEQEIQTKVLYQLEQSANAMGEIAHLANTTNELAGNASETNKKALTAVLATVQKMGEIRNTVSEAEKTTKRLGERSQEIGFIVEIIKDIAERTHTLALNAGMQAVVAGEAGRGFSIVADEVQRLAETSRESAKQITMLVRSLQTESSESMATMNKTIAQVVEVAELANRSGKRMNVTQKTTQELVTAVGQIAKRSKFLGATNATLHEQAIELQNSTQATEEAIKNQTDQTNVMIQILHNLVQSVRVFKLLQTV